MENTETDSGRKATAAIVGILLVVLLVVAAKWTGDKIRERLTKPKPIAVVEQTPADNLLGEKTKSATYSAIPETGPNDWLYAVVGLMLVSGLGVLRVAGRINY